MEGSISPFTKHLTPLERSVNIIHRNKRKIVVGSVVGVVLTALAIGKYQGENLPIPSDTCAISSSNTLADVPRGSSLTFRQFVSKISGATDQDCVKAVESKVEVLNHVAIGDNSPVPSGQYLVPVEAHASIASTNNPNSIP